MLPFSAAFTSLVTSSRALIKNQVNTFTGFLKSLTFCSYGNVFNGLHIHILAYNNTEPDILFTTIINVILKIV